MSKKLIEKIAKEIREAHSPQSTIPPTGADIAMATAALSAIRENASELVKPLTWTDGNCYSRAPRDLLGRYMVTESYKGDWDVEISSPGFCDAILKGYPNREEAKAAAQDHHVSRVLSLLNMEGE